MSKAPPHWNWTDFHKIRDLSTVWGMCYCHRAHAAKKHKETSFISLPEALLEPSGSAHSKSRIKTFFPTQVQIENRHLNNTGRDVQE